MRPMTRPHAHALPDLIDEAEIAKMKDGAILLNAARGKVVNVDATAAALRSGKLGGAAFDVYVVLLNSLCCCMC